MGDGFGFAPAESKVKGGPPDFANAKSTYKPGLDKYDVLLPSDYLSLIPKSARDAFEATRFDWGNVPEWVPPTEMR
ncbi:hypothetical protein EW146_g6130 [Bondarzewia mesenterica]|uniref:Uncharacterized protein n=1 Tax=Bondarzewia mesenterica TaxID=1095465 RepID=A0A4V3XEM2_9AGAM|nr:hypothetical protein EW146_g6130 [Bondarzewia mesenterica]